MNFISNWYQRIKKTLIAYFKTRLTFVCPVSTQILQEWRLRGRGAGEGEAKAVGYLCFYTPTRFLNFSCFSLLYNNLFRQGLSSKLGLH